MQGTEKTAALFDHWARSGRAEGMERGHAARAIQALEGMPLQAGQRALDLGCGNGWATRWMAEKVQPRGSATGVDAALEMVERSRLQSEGLDGLHFQQAVFETLPFPDAHFDHAFSMEALYYAPDLKVALASIARVLRPGGSLTICTDFFAENPHCLGWPEMMGVTMHLLSEDQWTDSLRQAGLELQFRWRCLDPRPVDPGLPEDERRAEEHFRRQVGALALRAIKPGAGSSPSQR